MPRAKGRGRGPADEIPGIKMETLTSTVDFVDLAVLRDLASRSVSAMISMDSLRSDCDERFFPESVQAMCYTFLQRSGPSGDIVVYYKPDSICEIAGVQGRQCAGLSSQDVPPEHPLRRTLAKVIHQMSVHRATRGCFNLPKLMKEMLRGGHSDSIRDYDISASFPRAILHRHGDLLFVRKWIEKQSEFVAACGLPRDVCKELVVAAAGIGMAGVDAWKLKHGAVSVPDDLKGYLNDVASARQRDVAAHPGLVAKLMEHGCRADYEVSNKIVFLLNSAYERRTLDAATKAVRGLVDVLSFEYDGVALRLCSGHTWAQVEEKLDPVFVYKPYRTMAQLWDTLSIKAEIPVARFADIDLQWEKLCQGMANLHRRLALGELPVLIAAGVLPYVLYDTGRTLLSTYKAGPGKCAGMSFYTYQEKSNGGFWARLNGEKVLDIEMDIVRALSVVLQVSVEDAPAEWMKGAFSQSILSRLGNVLFDASILGMLDSDASFKYLCFGCGTVISLETFNLVPASYDMFISKHTGYSYPTAEFAEVERQLTEKGVSLEEILKKARAWEGMPLNRGKLRYSQEIIDGLNTISALPCFELIDMMHKSFTTTAMNGEDVGGWLVTVFRVGKVPAAAVGKRAKNFVVDFGEEGGNGKGLLWNIIKATFGHLAAEISLAMLTKDPPSASQATPDVFELRGLRFTCTPESEKCLTIRSMWLKNFGDTSTVYTGRGLYMDNVKFKVPALYSISSNVKLELTSVDGGVMRRNIGVNWPVAFRADPKGDEERKVHDEDTESSAFYTPLRVAGYLYFVLKCLKVFFNEGSGLAYRPPQIEEATLRNVSNEYAVYIRDMVAKMVPCEGSKAVTKLKFLAAARSYISRLDELPDDEVKPLLVERAADTVVSFKIPKGCVQRVQRKSDRAWLQLGAAEAAAADV